MDFSKEQVLDALRKIIYPEKNRDIVSLGMVDDLKIEGKMISFSLLFTKPNDPFASSIRKACIQAITDHVDPEVQVRGNITIKNSGETMKKNDILPGIENIIAIASGKGGVGKSTVAVNIAVSLANKGFRVGLIDADIFGPSIPKMFNVVNIRPEVRLVDNMDLIVPIEKYGVKLLSIGFFINPDDALVWRGPMATNALKQMIEQGDWGDLDYLLVDLPPGTSDIHLTLVQEVPVTGAIIVSTPQEVALADAVKGISMFTSEKINVPILGLVENMAWFTPAELPENKYYIFGKQGCRILAENYNIELLGQIPIVERICEDGDSGKPSVMDTDSPVARSFIDLTDNLVKQVEIRNRELEPTKKVEIQRKQFYTS
ncbi:MAG: Mrp/NBP35 family ATP-binding protein [Bacteroidales bacterium]|nr:MAG: Mrp/NBP35 family ATP-binding protein [Bacteroidales bacterium]